jgi:hypothetical protein
LLAGRTRRGSRAAVQIAVVGLAVALAATTPAMASGSGIAGAARAATFSRDAGLLTRARPAGDPAAGASKLAAELQAAWRITRGRGVVVAVLSSGVVTVPGLTGKVKSGPDYAPLPDASMISGTVLADAIAGTGSASAGAFGQIGRAPDARILGIRVTGEGTEPGAARDLRDGVWQAKLAQGIMYAARHGAQVIVDPVTGYATTPGLDAAVTYAVEHGAVIVVDAASFGSTPNAASYPASLPGVVSVGDTVLTGQTAPPRKGKATPAGDANLITAPANVLPVTAPGDTPYEIFNQFSGLAWAAGTVALIKSAYPHLPPALVVRALAASATEGPPDGYSPKIGFGLINPAGAVRAAGRLARLQATASGAGTVAAAARLASGPRPALITAIHHSAVLLESCAALIAVGLILVLLALVAWRRRPATVEAVPPAPAAAA